MSKVFAVIALLLIVASLLGCVSKSNYNDLEEQLTALQEQSATRESELQAQIADKSAMLEQERSDKAQLQSNIASLEQDLDETQGKLDANLAELNKVLDTSMPQEYDFNFFRGYTWTLPIPLRAYFHYAEQPRATNPAQYKDMVTDNYSEDVLQMLVDQVKDSVAAYNLRSTDQINMIGAFVQSLPESNNDVKTPFDETPLYPVETLFKQGGDCLDNSMLAAAVLERLDFHVALLVFEKEKHVAVGIDAPALNGRGYELQAVRYYYLETTGSRSSVGESPEVYLSTPLIIPIN